MKSTPHSNDKTAAGRYSKEFIRLCVSEFLSMRQVRDIEEENIHLRAALFIEETFDLLLLDEEICAENLGNAHLETFVLKKCGL